MIKNSSLKLNLRKLMLKKNKKNNIKRNNQVHKVQVLHLMTHLQDLHHNQNLKIKEKEKIKNKKNKENKDHQVKEINTENKEEKGLNKKEPAEVKNGIQDIKTPKRNQDTEVPNIKDIKAVNMIVVKTIESTRKSPMTDKDKEVEKN